MPFIRPFFFNQTIVYSQAKFLKYFNGNNWKN